MFIDTTMNLDREVLARLDSAAEMLGVSRRHLVSSLLGFAPRRACAAAGASDRVRYQERRDKGKWYKLHVRLRKDEYEFFSDLRKVMKMSVSFIIAWAIEQYLEELSEQMKDDVDKYRYRNYAIMSKIIGNVTCLIIYWGIPPNLIPTP